MRLVLASKSKRRIELLRQMGFDFEVIPVDVDETLPPDLDARAASRDVAARKARAVAWGLADAIVIGADTVVSAGDEIIGKPADDADAERILRTLSGNRHSVITGVCLIDTNSGREQSDSDETVIHMVRMTDAQIRDYVQKGLSDGKAGAYGFLGDDDPYVKNVEGSCTNIMGLPTELLRAMLAKWGIH